MQREISAKVLSTNESAPAIEALNISIGNFNAIEEVPSTI